MKNGETLSKKNRDKTENAAYGYRLGLEFSFNISDRLRLYTGLDYANSGYEKSLYNTPFTYNNYPVKYGDVNFKYRFKYLDVPILLGYTLDNDQIRFTPIIGIKAAYLSAQKTKVLIKSGSSEIKYEDRLEDAYQRFSAWGFAGMDISYVQEDFIFSVRPFYERSLTSVFKSDNEQEFHFNYGAEIILSVKIKPRKRNIRIKPRERW